jgi:hypothetical protein
VVYAILRDKERLDAGEPTEITVSYTRHEIEGIDALAAALSQTLLTLEKQIDITPSPANQSRSLRSRGTVISGWRDWRVAVLQGGRVAVVQEAGAREAAESCRLIPPCDKSDIYGPPNHFSSTPSNIPNHAGTDAWMIARTFSLYSPTSILVLKHDDP